MLFCVYLPLLFLMRYPYSAWPASPWGQIPHDILAEIRYLV
ncbi:hypothetical protein HMPREF0880_02634 [Yokenella regensburgei ATCC 43003]|nr:hypothetical protein HMPREF0880_02634 [Yokenella regensburgei ATCC 43003]